MSTMAPWKGLSQTDRDLQCVIIRGFTRRFVVMGTMAVSLLPSLKNNSFPRAGLNVQLPTVCHFTTNALSQML